jgi:hypothetical protein
MCRGVPYEEKKDVVDDLLVDMMPPDNVEEDEDEEDTDTICRICNHRIGDEENSIDLPCDHMFHQKCYLTKISSAGSFNCPSCSTVPYGLSPPPTAILKFIVELLAKLLFGQFNIFYYMNFIGIIAGLVATFYITSMPYIGNAICCICILQQCLFIAISYAVTYVIKHPISLSDLIPHTSERSLFWF